MPTKIQLRRGTASEWMAANPILAAGETGFETDTKKAKVGDGSTAWNSLGYTFVSQADLSSSINGHVAQSDPHSQYETKTAAQAALDLKYDASNPSGYVNTAGASAAAPVQSVAGKTGAVTLEKSDVGLENVVNVDATLRSNHTGTQTASTISDFSAAVDGVQLSAFVATKEPTGHEDRTKSTVNFDESTRTFSISPVSGSFIVWIAGAKQTITTTLSVQIPDTSGNYFFYIDSSGNLQYQASFDISLFEGKVYTGFVHWNSADNQAIVWGEERHGIVMDGATHSYLHTTRGTQLVSGGSISYTGGAGNSNSDAQFGVGDLRIRDEDIQVNIANSANPSAPFQQVLFPIAEIPVLYREGSEWKKSIPSQYPILTGSNRAKYNEYAGSTWQLTEATSNGKFLITYIFATTDFRTPIFGILGQAQYNTLDDAKALGGWDQITFGDLPAQELKLLYIIYYETSSGMMNTPKAGIVEIVDARFTADRQVSASSFNGDHSNLSGLSNDDHLQYLNETRGDLRYYTKTQADSAFESKNANIQSHIGSTLNPHFVTKAQVGLGSVDDVSASSLRDRNTHTGTQLAATISDFTTAVQAVSLDASNIDGGQVSNTEFSFLNGVTSSIQTQIDGKQATITGAATTITNTNLSANKALTSDGSGKVSASTTSATELGYVSGVTSAIQTQIDGKRGFLNLQVLTSGTTYTPTSGATYIKAILIGGGGGGGGVTGATNNIGAAGGGGSGAMLVVATSLTGAASYTYSIGALGTGGAAGANNGLPGGNTTLTIGATTYTATGGSGGTSQTAGTTVTLISGGAGGTTPTGGTLNLPGKPGGIGWRSSGTVGQAGAGADSFYGFGGQQPIVAANGTSGLGYGAGGSGGYSTANVSRSGGNGTAGVIIIREYK